MVDPYDPLGPVLFRHRKALSVIIGILKTATAQLHQEAALLKGRESKELREVADDLDDYAEGLKQHLNGRRFP